MAYPVFSDSYIHSSDGNANSMRDTSDEPKAPGDPGSSRRDGIPDPVTPSFADRDKGVEVKVKDANGNIKDHGKLFTFGPFGNHLRSAAKGAGDVLIGMTGQVFDLTLFAKTQYTGNRHGLCSACSSMPFGQFKQGAERTLADPSTQIVRPLHMLLKHENSCNFCGLVCRALDCEVNDPWDLLGVIRNKSHTPPVHWVEPESPGTSFTTTADSNTTVTIRDEARLKTLSQLNDEIVPNLAFLERLQRHRLPCWVFIDIKNTNHKDSGLVIIEV